MLPVWFWQKSPQRAPRNFWPAPALVGSQPCECLDRSCSPQAPWEHCHCPSPCLSALWGTRYRNGYCTLRCLHFSSLLVLRVVYFFLQIQHFKMSPVLRENELNNVFFQRCVCCARMRVYSFGFGTNSSDVELNRQQKCTKVICYANT